MVSEKKGRVSSSKSQCFMKIGVYFSLHISMKMGHSSSGNHKWHVLHILNPREGKALLPRAATNSAGLKRSLIAKDCLPETPFRPYSTSNRFGMSRITLGLVDL